MSRFFFVLSCRNKIKVLREYLNRFQAASWLRIFQFVKKESHWLNIHPRNGIETERVHGPQRRWPSRGVALPSGGPHSSGFSVSASTDTKKKTSRTALHLAGMSRIQVGGKRPITYPTFLLNPPGKLAPARIACPGHRPTSGAGQDGVLGP